MIMHQGETIGYSTIYTVTTAKFFPPSPFTMATLETANPNEEHINERVHWSVVAKHQDRTTPP